MLSTTPKTSSAWRSTTAILMAFLLVSFVAFIPNANAQEKLKAPKAIEPATQKSDGGPKEGIKVHGHWVIEVREPGGKLVERREFENALTSQGWNTLSAVLSRSKSPGLWSVLLDSNGTKPCTTGTGEIVCAITEAGSVGTYSNWFKNLTVTSDGRITLRGTATAAYASNIDIVRTLLEFCSSSVSPANTPGDSSCFNGTFTSATLATPVSVAPGQIMQVTVVISFS